MMLRTKWVEAGGSFALHARDYWALTKPKVVSLLVLTTLVSMALSLPLKQGSAERMLVVLVGGWLSAAGASALNQYFDREIDGQMARTRNRPIPAGRVPPGQALAFALALVLISTALLWFGANPLAASLALVGVLYYAGVYTLLLKRYDFINVIIGGGAGAMPVLVGWAAGAGKLQPEALLLFAIVFFWSPPHSWALALLVEKDYREAGVPLMPFALGPLWTRLQVIWFSLLLTVITLLPLPFQMAGWLYFWGALVLGCGLLAKSLILLSEGTRQAARKMYKYSSLYLGLLFLLMLLDRLLWVR
jgi:heme o synthase